MKVIVSSGLALVLGAVGGLAAMHARLQPQLDAAVLEQQALRQQLNAMPDMSTEQARLERLERENAENIQRLAALNQEMDEWRLAYEHIRAQAEMADAGLETLPTLDMGELFQFDQAPNATQARGRGAWNREQEDDGDDEEAAERRREREAARQEWAERARERMYDRLNDALARTDDPLVQDRIHAVADYMEYFSEMRDEMRTAQTDEERQVLREAMRTSMGDLQQMMRDHQNDLLHGVAAQYGLDPQQQQQIVRDLRSTMRDPVYNLQAGGGRGGGIPGAPQGGWGRGGGRGGG